MDLSCGRDIEHATNAEQAVHIPILPNRATDDPPERLAGQRRFNPKSKI
jgi:hypothetical protein